jgi:glycosyltransferase involved in cell wall biosynthesis
MTGLARPRVAIVTSGLGPAQGGIGVVAQMIVRVLAPDCEVGVFRFHAGWPRWARWSEALTLTAARVVAYRPDFVLYDHVDLARLQWLLPTRRRPPYVVFVHGIEAWRPLDALRRRALERARLLLANSQFTVETTRRHNPWFPGATVVWLAASSGNVALPPSRREALALIVGRMDPSERGKGHDAVLDAWPAVRSALPDARLVVVGDGRDRARLEARVRAERLEGVRFLGFVDDAALGELRGTARVFLFPSVQEGFGIAGVEAASAGLPIVGVRGTVIEELFPAEGGALLAAEQTGSALVAPIVALLGDADRAAALGKLGQARASMEFTEPAFGARLRHALGDAGLLGVGGASR